MNNDINTDKRELILDTAERLLTEVSDKALSVSRIASEAGIGKGSIYYYFNSKEEILYAVIERGYRKALGEYFSSIDPSLSALDKIKLLFRSTIKKEFSDKRTNLFRSLHLNDSLILHNYIKQITITESTPILEKLLIQGVEEGSIKTDIPGETAEMIVAVLTFFLDGTVFNDDAVTYKKLKLFATILNNTIAVEKGSFDFLFDLDCLDA